MKLPIPIQTQPKGVVVRQDGPGRFDIREGIKPGVRSLFVQGQAAGRLPFITGGGRLRARSEAGQEGQQKKEKRIHTKSIKCLAIYKEIAERPK